MPVIWTLFFVCEDVAGRSQQSGGELFCFFARTHFLACEGLAAGFQQSGGESFFFARTHFLACEGVAGGSQQSGGKSFFSDALPCVRRCRWWVPAVRGVNRFFSDALPCVRRCSWWVPVVKGRIIFLHVIWTHFLACEDVAGGSQQSGGNVFSVKYSGPSGGSQLSGGGIIILHVIKRHFLAGGRGPSCQPLHAQSTSDGVVR